MELAAGRGRPFSGRWVELVDLPAIGRATRLVWHKHRWRCPAVDCAAQTVTEQDREMNHLGFGGDLVLCVSAGLAVGF